MKALSIRQPWAWLIANGHKDIENRTWSTKFRGRVLIHASKGMTREEYENALVAATYAGSKEIASLMPGMKELERGGIVGVATISDCVSPDRRLSPWHIPGQFGFQITEATPLPFIECKGALGFFNVYSDVAKALRQMHANATP